MGTGIGFLSGLAQGFGETYNARKAREAALAEQKAARDQADRIAAMKAAENG